MDQYNPQPSLPTKIVAIVLALGGILILIPALVRLATGSASAGAQLILVVFGVIAIVVGRGLIKLKRPLFYLALALLGLATLWNAVAIVFAFREETRGAILATTLFTVLSFALFILLIRGRKDFLAKKV